MTDWVRLWHDMPTDPKWRVVARRSGQPLPAVIAVFTMMMTNASANSADRGTLAGWDDEDVGAALDMDGEDVCAIREAMQGKVLDGAALTGWERRQPKREDGTAAERKAAWKARQGTQRNAAERTGTQEHAPETETETETETERGVVDVAREPISARPDGFAHDLFSLTNEVCRAAGIRHIEPGPIARHVDIVKAWVSEGFDPVETIVPAVQEAIASATERISSLAYFDRSIRQFQARKEARSNGFTTRETNVSPSNPMVRAIGARRARRAVEGSNEHEVCLPDRD